MNRYEIIANNLATQIREGLLPAGARLPSLRHLIAQYRTHVFQASKGTSVVL